MYVTEYRKALRDAGFDGFRVLLFQQQRRHSSRPAATRKTASIMGPEVLPGRLVLAHA
jgi:predicted nucleotide-binding protein (sugar kinase/HSP70/actin superfamily)